MNTNVDTSSYIFDYLYTCRVPLHATISENEMRVFGYMHTGNPDIDRGTREQYVTVMWPIYKMAKAFGNGDAVKLVKYSDAKEVYEHVEKHLHAWKIKLETAFHIADAPLKDLVLLDEFASSVYEHAKYNFTNQYVESLMMRDLTAISAINRSNLFKTKRAPPVVSNSNVKHVTEDHVKINSNSEDNHVEREMLGDVFKSRIVGRSGWR